MLQGEGEAAVREENGRRWSHDDQDDDDVGDRARERRESAR